jgi:putative membrane protein
MRLILREHADTTGIAKAVGKYSALAVVVTLQALLTFLMLASGLGVQAPHYFSLLLTMIVASLVFLGMVFALFRLFGDAGKLLAVFLLTLQLAAGGGVMPIELSGGLFRAIHDWLPFTCVVKAFRASLFGAYDNAWAETWGTVMIAGGVAFTLSSFFGHWKVVDEADYRPGIEV